MFDIVNSHLAYTPILPPDYQHIICTPSTRVCSVFVCWIQLPFVGEGHNCEAVIVDFSTFTPACLIGYSRPLAHIV